jgi:hypothetical protein
VLCPRRELIEMRAQLACAIAQRADLKAELLERDLNLLFTRQPAHQLHSLVRYDERQQLLVEREIFDQRRLRPKVALELRDVEGFHHGRRPAAVRRAIRFSLLDLAVDQRYLGLTLADGGLKRGHGRRAARGLAIRRTIDLAVEPVQLLA